VKTGQSLLGFVYIRFEVTNGVFGGIQTVETEYKQSYIEGYIRGRIAETIAEWMFRDFGFYVIKFGQEHEVSPLTQLKEFLTQFKVDFPKGNEYLTGDFGQIQVLPDFVVAHPNGIVRFIEVKYTRSGGLLPRPEKNERGYSKRIERLQRFFRYTPHACILWVNYNADAMQIIEDYGKIGQKQKDFIDRYSHTDHWNALSATKFHIWQEHYMPTPIGRWLKEKYDFSEEELKKIKKYDSMVQRWFRAYKKMDDIDSQDEENAREKDDNGPGETTSKGV
jgi:hypothetical protein